MSTAAMTLGLRPRLRLGPALRRFHVPLGPLVLSAGAHVALGGALLATALLWPAEKTRTYVVNLVPAVAAVGSPQGRTTAPAAQRVTPPAPAEKSPPKELPPPARETSRDLPPLTREASRELPPPGPLRDARRELPPPAPVRDSAPLPDRPLPPRVAGLPRAGEKELPALPRPPAPRSPEPAAREPVNAPPAAPPPPPPPAALGDVGGTAQGAGALTLNVSDFPYAWYLQAIHRKIQERWEGRAIQGRQPEVIFEIARDGQLKRLTIGKTSGNPAYDQLAMRAISEANPFPALPEGFGKSSLTIGLQFVYDPRAR